MQLEVESRHLQDEDRGNKYELMERQSVTEKGSVKWLHRWRGSVRMMGSQPTFSSVSPFSSLHHYFTPTLPSNPPYFPPNTSKQRWRHDGTSMVPCLGWSHRLSSILYLQSSICFYGNGWNYSVLWVLTSILWGHNSWYVHSGLAISESPSLR